MASARAPDVQPSPKPSRSEASAEPSSVVSSTSTTELSHRFDTTPHDLADHNAQDEEDDGAPDDFDFGQVARGRRHHRLCGIAAHEGDEEVAEMDVAGSVDEAGQGRQRHRQRVGQGLSGLLLLAAPPGSHVFGLVHRGVLVV